MTIIGIPIESETLDSYVTLAEADLYLYNRIDSDSWNEASTANKTSALNYAKEIIDSLPLRGVRYESYYLYNGVQKDLNADGIAQSGEFPRYIDDVACDFDYGTNLPVVPKRVKDACCLTALKLLTDANSSGDQISEEELQAKGITSFSLGRLSMSFGPGANTKYYGLDKKSYDLMRIYIESTPMVL